MNDAIPSELRDAAAQLTETVLASEQLEDLGELLVLQLSEDLIGEPDQADDDEELIRPLPREAAFLREIFVRLLTPQSVLELYELGRTPMAVAILDAETREPLAQGVLSGADDRVSYNIPGDGWYILSKNAAEGQEGSTILAARGIFPIVERTLSATESRFVRLTDNELVVTESRPKRDDGKAMPFVVLIDNQFRGLRDLQTYLVHFIPPFFEQVEALLVPFLITVAWGFVLGRALAHLLGEKFFICQRSQPSDGLGPLNRAAGHPAALFRLVGRWRDHRQYRRGFENRDRFRRGLSGAPGRSLAEPQQYGRRR